MVISHPASSRSSIADTTEESHCTAGQIADSTTLSSAAGLSAEGGWPWIRAPVVFLSCGEWQDGRTMRVDFVLSPLVFFSFLPGGFLEVSRLAL